MYKYNFLKIYQELFFFIFPKKHKEKVDVRHIIMDIVALNVFPFIAYPIMQILFGKEFINMTNFMEQRKKETVETMMCRLQKIL